MAHPGDLSCGAANILPGSSTHLHVQRHVQQMMQQPLLLRAAALAWPCSCPNHCMHSSSPLPPTCCRLSGVWRTSFALGFLPLLYMLYYRIFRLRESAVWKKRMSQVSTQKQTGHFALLIKHYWQRLLATAGCWFLWDYR